MDKIQFGIVGGGGWRAKFFLRVAQALPQRFEVVGSVVRDPAKARAFEAEFGVPTYRSVDAMLTQHQPAFAVVSVTRNAASAVLRELAQRGMPALCETPPSDDLNELAQLHDLTKQGAKIQVAEQYQYQPMHAARLAVVKSGKLGQVTQAQVSVAHGYHGISLIRQFLSVGFDDVTVRAQRFTSPIVAGPRRGEMPEIETLRESKQTIAYLDFGGKLGVYDFTGDQYHSAIRSPRLLVRGERGELCDCRVKYLLDHRTPIEMQLLRMDAGHGGNLEGYHHKGVLAGEQWIYRSPIAPARLSDEEIAVATCLLKMAEYVDGGAEFYSIAEAAQDVYLERLTHESVESGQPVSSTPQAWTR